MQRDEFIESLLKFVPKYGWTLRAMRDASSNLGLDPEYHQILFQDGAQGARRFYDTMLDAQMMEMLAVLPRPEKIRERIALALNIRIVKLGDYYYKSSMEAVWKTVDSMWRYAGDTSTDFNYYTKRGLLATIYIACKRHYARDTSFGFVGTEEYIDKSINKLLKIGSLKHKLLKIENIPILRGLLGKYR